MPEEPEIRFVYVTTADRAEALRIGRAIVERRLVACVNVIDRMTSMYWWKGQIECSDEAILLAKTTTARVPDLVAAVRELHSYECPCVVALPVVGGHAEYLEWIRAEAAGSSD